MKDIIKDLTVIKYNIGVIISILEGNWTMRMMSDGGTVSGELSCYENEGKDLQICIEKLLKDYGDEMLPTRD